MIRIFTFVSALLIIGIAPVSAQTDDAFAQDEEQEAPALTPAASAADMIAVFRDLCFAPFPSREDFQRAMEDNTQGFVRDRTSRAPWRWDNGSINLDYVTERMARGAMPAPQCAVATTIAMEPDHLAIASRIDSGLLVGQGKSSGRRGRNTTIWNIKNSAGQPLRIFFRSEPEQGQRLKARLIVMQLSEYAVEPE